MKCPRCKGKMFTQRYFEFVRSFDAWSCVCCGELLDPTIVANRVKKQQFTQLISLGGHRAAYETLTL